MKTYTIDRVLREGIALAEDGTISVGERGRGRTFVAVPVPAGAEVRDGTLWSVPASKSEPAAVAVLLIRDHSGFRGGWRLGTAAERRCPEARDLAVPPREAPLGPCAGCGVTAWTGRVPLWRDEHALVPNRALSPDSIGKVLAAGEAAQGAAGRMGGGAEYLILARPGRFSIRRSGRLYGAPAVLNVTVTADGHVIVEDAAAVIAAAEAAAAW